jgi:hypothetical protein
LRRAGDDDAETLGIGSADFATHFQFHQGFLREYLKRASLKVLSGIEGTSRELSRLIAPARSPRRKWE